jgi:hypothetical protein
LLPAGNDEEETMINTSKPALAAVAAVRGAQPGSANVLRKFELRVTATLRGLYERRVEKSLMRLAPTRSAQKNSK